MNLRFERMTIFCSDVDASVSFYRDLIGLCVVEDKVIEGPAAGSLLQLPPCRVRITLLAPSADEDPILGLFEIGGISLGTTAIVAGQVTIAQTAVVLSTNAFGDVRDRLQAANARFLTPPVQYPKREASARSPAGLYHEMIVYDPDNILVSIMQIDPLTQDQQA